MTPGTICCDIDGTHAVTAPSPPTPVDYNAPRSNSKPCAFCGAGLPSSGRQRLRWNLEHGLCIETVEPVRAVLVCQARRLTRCS